MKNRQTKSLFIYWLSAILAVYLSSCGGSSEKQSGSDKSREIEPEIAQGPVALAGDEEVLEFYAAKPDFFRVKTIEDLPDDLSWADGSDQAEFASPEAKQGGTLKLFTGDWPRTLRFVGPDANGAFRRYILDNNAYGLVGTHPEGDGYIPGLAKEWAMGNDGKTVYFRLDPDARYSDGKRVRVTDFFFLFYFMQSKHLQAPWYNDYYSEEKFENVTLYDTRTLSITFYKAKPDVIEKVSLRPVPQHFYKFLDQDYLKEYQWKMEPTTGPYEVLPENVEDGVAITLTRVPDWWADKKKFSRYRFNPEKVRITVVREPNKAFELFRKGELDWHSLSVPEYWYEKLPDDAPEVANGYIHKVQFYNVIPRPSWALRINSGIPPLDNEDVRIGIHHSMNWDLVIEKIFHGDFQRMRTVADGYGDRSHPTLMSRGFSVEKATESFTKAGYLEKGPDGILINDDGDRLAFTLTTGYKRFASALTVLQQEAKKAGLELNLEILEMTAAWKKLDEKNHQIGFGALNRSVELYPRFWEPFHSDNAYVEEGESKYDDNGTLKNGLTPKTDTNNDTQTAVREIDRLIDRYRKSESLEEITSLSHTLSEKLHDHAGFIPAWVKPWYRVGHWRWVKWPKGFNVKESRRWDEFSVHWIDEEAKAETEKAKVENKSFPPSIKTFDQYMRK